jgi:hypothetical protein
MKRCTRHVDIEVKNSIELVFVLFVDDTSPLLLQQICVMLCENTS